MLVEQAQQIKCLICDLDGVLTSGLIFLNNTGNDQKSFHIHDGLGLKLLQAVGIEVAIITGSKQVLIEQRMQQLDIKHVYQGQINKQSAYQHLKSCLNLADHQMAYVGDDLPDMPIMQQVGMSVAVANAVDSVKNIADWITTHPGGYGAVREVCDMILSAQHKTQIAIDNFLGNNTSNAGTI